jgi:hypothetical protein
MNPAQLQFVQFLWFALTYFGALGLLLWILVSFVGDLINGKIAVILSALVLVVALISHVIWLK